MTLDEWKAHAEAALVQIYDGLGERPCLDGHRAFVGDRALMELFVKYQDEPYQVIVALGIVITSAQLGDPYEVIVDGSPSPVRPGDDPILLDIRQAHMTQVDAVGDESWRGFFPPVEVVRQQLAAMIREGRKRGEC